jgi:hypothetical protein
MYVFLGLSRVTFRRHFKTQRVWGLGAAWTWTFTCAARICCRSIGLSACGSGKKWSRTRARHYLQRREGGAENLKAKR